MAQISGGSSSPSRAMKRRLNDGVACSLLVEDKGLVDFEEEGDMDEEDEDDDDDDEDSIRIFEVGDGVWESKTFSKWRKLNWACFYYDIHDDFFRLPTDYFKPGEDPRTQIPYDLKMGYWLGDYKEHEPQFRKSSPGARLAIEFFNKENKMGKTLKYKSLSKVSRGTRCCEPRGYIYFLTFVATETDSGVEREFQASLFRPIENMNIWNLRAFREKPYVF